MLKVEKIEKGNITVIRHEGAVLPSLAFYNGASVYYRDKQLGILWTSKNSDAIEVQYFCDTKNTNRRRRYKLKKAKTHAHQLLLAFMQTVGMHKLSLSHEQYRAMVFEDAKLLIRSEYYEIFWPFAFYKDQRLMGGLYIYPWLCGDATLESYFFKNAPQDGMDVLTGICPFANDVYGIDGQGKKHLLDHSSCKISKQDTQIISIAKSKEKSPYIDFNYEVLVNLLPLIHGLTQLDKPTIYFHFPIYEYILVAIQYFLTDIFNFDVFNQYVELLLGEVFDLHRSKMEMISSKHGIKFELVSPLKILLEPYLSNKQFDLLEFLKLLSINKANIFEKNNLLVAATRRLLAKLVEDDTHRAWENLQPMLNSQEMDLIEIGRHCYSIQIAHVKASTAKSLCLIDSQFEKSIALNYKKLFAGTFGTIMAMHWMPPCFANLNEHNSFYYLSENHIPYINQLMKNGVVTKSCIRIGELVDRE